MATAEDIPRIYELFKPLMATLRSLGGSGTIQEIEERFSEQNEFPEDYLEVLGPRGGQPLLMYRLAWARIALKVFGTVENSSRGVWSLTPKAQEFVDFDPIEVRDQIRALRLKQRKARKTFDLNESSIADDGSIESDNDSWQDTVIATILDKLSPNGFERLIQRVLRESGFTQVEVTGRTGDQGIDGKGIAKIHGLMSFHVVFQAKRYKGSVSAGDIRDFRGAMAGKAEKGLFITSGTFTRAAKEEASRDGAPPIDLIDGVAFAQKLKELELGVSTRQIEEVDVHEEWFEELETS